MILSFITKYKSAIILTLVLTVFLASCKGISDDPKSWVVRTFAGTAGTSGTTATSISAPQGVAVDSNGIVYVADTANNRIQQITSAGVVSTLAGTGTAGTANTDTANNVVGTLSGPEGVAVDSSGENLYVAGTVSSTIRKIVISTGAVSTFAGTAGTPGTTATSISAPQGVAVDSNGIVYVADTANNRIQQITSAGVVSTLAGSGTATATSGTPTPDGTGAAATFNGPQGVAVVGGNVYVADTGSHTIRKIASGGVVTTIGGTVNVNTAGFNAPSGVAVDSDGNVYVADTTGHRIRKITSAGKVTTIAGTGTAGTTDGGSAVAKFSSPQGVAVRSSGELYVADTGSHTIRKIELK